MLRVAIAVVEQDEQFLVGQRGQDVVLPNVHEFPGGKMQNHESAATAAERECLEETGLKVEADTTIQIVRHHYPHGEVELHFIACHIVDPADASEPLSPFRWIARDRMASLEFPEANFSVLRRLGLS